MLLFSTLDCSPWLYSAPALEFFQQCPDGSISPKTSILCLIYGHYRVAQRVQVYHVIKLNTRAAPVILSPHEAYAYQNHTASTAHPLTWLPLPPLLSSAFGAFSILNWQLRPVNGVPIPDYILHIGPTLNVTQWSLSWVFNLIYLHTIRKSRNINRTK